MSQLLDIDQKHVVPIWRPARDLLISPEANYNQIRQTAPIFRESQEFAENLEDFNKEKSFDAALSLVRAGFTVGKSSEIKAAAAYLLKQRAKLNPLDTSICESVIDPTFSASDLRNTLNITIIREKLKDFPRQPFLWLELARIYAISGSIEKAKKAAQTASALAPSDRLISRSTSRFFLSAHEESHALEILRRAFRINPDPWIAATLVSLSTICERPISALRLSRPDLYAQGLQKANPELISAIGMLELANGKDSKAKKHFLKAWELPPTEAVISHAEWVTREILKGQREIVQPHFTNSAEALAWYYYNQKELTQSLKSMETWKDREPFLNRPYAGSSFIAALQEDYKYSEIKAREGLKRNPDHFLLRNNLVFALVRQGKFQEALLEAKRLKQPKDSNMIPIYNATKGLLAFAAGEQKAGAALYKTAIEGFKSIGDSPNMILSTLFFLETLSQFGLLKNLNKDEESLIQKHSKSSDTAISIMANRFISL